MFRYKCEKYTLTLAVDMIKNISRLIEAKPYMALFSITNYIDIKLSYEKHIEYYIIVVPAQVGGGAVTLIS